MSTDLSVHIIKLKKEIEYCENFILKGYDNNICKF